ncbi:SMI1/KNR4 family protein [Desulfonatronum lacustre]|uniref:SMI1/KNR4 family protein n=1 Tax=Desulfonatronum lacustre TaxID=66849 RepID=UPI00049062E5|nr:SMI1/KNR4 family protein [Desulfonatronum lacustre]
MDSFGKAARVARVQAELGVRVPPDYAEFLVRYGHAETGGLTIYGYSQDMADAEAVPCVIGATKRLRPIHGLRRDELVLAQNNGSLIVLDCASGMVLEVDCLERRRIVARCFDLWMVGLKQGEGRRDG